MASVKGIQVADLVRALQGMREQLEGRVPEHLERYLGERVLVSSSYPESDFCDMVGARCATPVD